MAGGRTGAEGSEAFLWKGTGSLSVVISIQAHHFIISFSGNGREATFEILQGREAVPVHLFV
jgi:hypothetical protein